MSHSEAIHPAAHGSLRSHLIGYALSLVLTFLSFGAVMGRLLPPRAGLALIVALVVQTLVAGARARRDLDRVERRRG